MDSHSIEPADTERPGISRLEMLLVLAVLSMLAVYGALTWEPAAFTPLVILLLIAAALNLGLLWLERRGLPPRPVRWAARLGNLALLTAGIYLTGGFDSPFFSLYVVYIVVASLRDGWRGAGRAVLLCLTGWLVLLGLEFAVEHADLTRVDTWLSALGRIGLWAAIFMLIASAVGALAQRHLNLENALLHRERELTFLQNAGRRLNMSLEPQQVLAATLREVRELMDVEAASLALVERPTGRITFTLVAGGADQAVEGLRLEPGQGIIGQVIQEGKAILVPDAASDPRFFMEVDRLSGFQTRSLLAVPLCHEGQIIGALEVLNKQGTSFGQEDLRLLSAMSDLAAPAIENARLHDEVRQHAEHLQTAYDEVRRVDELKSAFIRNVSHELRTPLALIQGYTELLLDEQLGPLRDEQRDSLTVVAERAAALNRMVNDFISLQTIGDLGYDLETLNLVIMAHAAADAVRSRAAKARIDLHLELPPPETVPPIRGDVQRLRRVFDHLLDNAIKFSPNGGLVRLSVNCQGEMIRVQVRDQGIGLSTEQLQQVFERFYQVDGASTRRYGGTGLGLAVVKEVVEAHGGAVWAESDGLPGRGSTFTFFVPMASMKKSG